MVSEIYSSFKEGFRERFSSPLLFIYSLATLSYNHDFFLWLISDVPVDNKIFNLDLYLSSNIEILRNFIFIPLGISILFVILYPLINIGVIKYWYTLQSITDNIRNKASKKRLLSEEESQRYILNNTELFNALNELHKENDELKNLTSKKPDKLQNIDDNKISDEVSPDNILTYEQEAEVESKERPHNSLSNSLKTLKDLYKVELNILEFATIALFGDYPGIEYSDLSIKDALQENLKESFHIYEYDKSIKHLIELGLINKNQNGFHLTDAGKDFYIKYRLNKDLSKNLSKADNPGLLINKQYIIPSKKAYEAVTNSIL